MKTFQFTAFSQRGRGKLHNEDAVLLDSQVYQGSIREHGIVDILQPRYFARVLGS
jgi:protein phosphatase